MALQFSKPATGHRLGGHINPSPTAIGPGRDLHGAVAGSKVSHPSRIPDHGWPVDRTGEEIVPFETLKKQAFEAIREGAGLVREGAQR